MFYNEKFEPHEPGMYQPGEIARLEKLGRMVQDASRQVAVMRWYGASQQQIDAVTDPIEKLILSVKPKPIPREFQSRR